MANTIEEGGTLDPSHFSEALVHQETTTKDMRDQVRKVYPLDLKEMLVIQVSFLDVTPKVEVGWVT